MWIISRPRKITHLVSTPSFPSKPRPPSRTDTDCIASQAQIMAVIPTFTGNDGPILSLTGDRRATASIITCPCRAAAAFAHLHTLLTTRPTRLHFAPQNAGVRTPPHCPPRMLPAKPHRRQALQQVVLPAWYRCLPLQHRPAIAMPSPRRQLGSCSRRSRRRRYSKRAF
jgi:hypothetical protein